MKDRLKNALRPAVNAARYIRWRFAGRPLNDGHSFSKRARLRVLGGDYDCETFVETGTYQGDTVKAMHPHFVRVLSVELSADLYQRARRRFADVGNVRLYHGDSGTALRQMTGEIVGRALFWLDGHHSGTGTAFADTECPLERELSVIAELRRPDHVIVIDDARFLGNHPDYPTMDDVRRTLLSINPDYTILSENDWVVAVPKR